MAVTINYRLGPMGFVCLPELADEAGFTGNYAFLDQLAALQWVRANIAAFGGDANNIPHHQGAVLQGCDEQRRRREPDADGQAR